ncbi:DUF2955 domain-containing protein [Halieaceae bacterium IMCC14734]|uniref:DUF2955 domain-containing protein n=2 Tax=Candidatus Litorirhabdus singularis TaxID=2518993 RepID=A0ABT3TMC2_9GAMM|nr:DUF2955 domain-containing protein [Candidatus Litorirhabdus singularis]
MDVAARRVFRLSLTVALTLAAAYAIPLEMPFLAPIFAFMLAAAPKPPMGVKGMLGLMLVLTLTLGVGLLLLPVLMHYPLTGLLLVFVGLFVTNFLSINLGKGAAATLLTAGITMITAAGTVSYVVASSIIDAMVLGVALAVVCHWLVYPLFPEDSAATPVPEPAVDVVESNWLALRATLIVFPSFLLVLVNPAAYMPIVMKAVSLGQQTSILDARHAGKELLGSTLLAGLFAVVLWFGLSIAPNLWMFFLWTLLLGIFLAGKFYGVLATRYPPSFWQNVLVTMLILLGPAVEDSASGKDVYKAFAVRMGLFLLVTLYAWMALIFLEWLRARSSNRALGALEVG